MTMAHEVSDEYRFDSATDKYNLLVQVVSKRGGNV
jgi:hypothetical protein